MSSISSEEEFQKKTPGKCQPCLAFKDVLKLFRKKEAVPLSPTKSPAKSCCTSSGCTAAVKTEVVEVVEVVAPNAPMEVLLVKAVREELEVEPPSTAASPAAASSLSVELAAAAAAPLSEETVAPAGEVLLQEAVPLVVEPVVEGSQVVETVEPVVTAPVTMIQEAAPVIVEQATPVIRSQRLSQAPGMKSPIYPVSGIVQSSPRPITSSAPLVRPATVTTAGRERVHSFGSPKPQTIYRSSTQTTYAATPTTTTRPAYSTLTSQATSPSLRAMAGKQVAAAQPVRTVYRPQQRAATSSATKLA